MSVNILWHSDQYFAMYEVWFLERESCLLKCLVSYWQDHVQIDQVSFGGNCETTRAVNFKQFRYYEVRNENKVKVI